jgi:hypothetical protein
MPMKIVPEDRKLFIGFAVLMACALLLAGYAVRNDRGSGGIPSSYSAGNSGTKVAFLLLQQMGYAVQRWSEDPRKLEELRPGATLILADPLPAEDRDMEAVRNFVRKGGRAVVTGAGASPFFPTLRPMPGTPHFQWKSYRPTEPSDLTRGVDEISMAPQFYFDSARGETPFSDGSETPVARFGYGAGEVIWWSSSDPMTNSAIREKDNAQFLLNSVGDPGGGPVYWDEYFHQNGRTVVDSILRSPLRWGLMQAALIGLAVISTFSRRFGPQRMSVAVSRAAPMEYVETMASLYHKAGAAQIPVEVVYERFRTALQRRYSVRTDSTVEQVARTIVHRLGGTDLAAVTKTLREVESSRDDPAFPVGRALALVRQMHIWITRLK